MLRAVPMIGAHGGFQVRRVQIRQLDLGDFFHLLARHLGHLVAVRLGRTLDDSRGALQQLGSRRRLGDEGELRSL